MYAFLSCALKTNHYTLSRHVYMMKIAIRVLRNKTKRPKQLYCTQCTRFKHTQIKQSGFTIPRQTSLNKVAVHFLGIYSVKQRDCALFKHARSELNSRTLSTVACVATLFRGRAWASAAECEHECGRVRAKRARGNLRGEKNKALFFSPLKFPRARFARTRLHSPKSSPKKRWPRRLFIIIIIKIYLDTVAIQLLLIFNGL